MVVYKTSPFPLLFYSKYPHRTDCRQRRQWVHQFLPCNGISSIFLCPSWIAEFTATKLYDVFLNFYSNAEINLRPRQNGRHFPDDIFNCNSVNETFWILNKISLKCVPRGLIGNRATLVQIMAWRRSGDKPLSEAMLVCLLTRRQWANVQACRAW